MLAPALHIAGVDAMLTWCSKPHVAAAGGASV